MPSQKKYNARFPPARIKKIMQTDEEIGKVAAPVPVIIFCPSPRVLEMFVKNLLNDANGRAESNQARTLHPAHLVQAITAEPRFHFLQETLKTHYKGGEEDVEGVLRAASAPSTNAGGRGKQRGRPPKRPVPHLEPIGSAPPPKRGRGRPRKQASEPAFMDDVLPDASRVASPALHGSIPALHRSSSLVPPSSAPASDSPPSLPPDMTNSALRPSVLQHSGLPPPQTAPAAFPNTFNKIPLNPFFPGINISIPGLLPGNLPNITQQPSVENSSKEVLNSPNGTEKSIAPSEKSLSNKPAIESPLAGISITIGSNGIQMPSALTSNNTENSDEDYDS